MLKGSWKESNLDFIDITIPDENIDKEALDTAFGSLYSDDVVIAPTTVIPVLAAATLLSLEDLIIQCAFLMMETMSAKSVCCYHMASLMYGQSEVTEACLDWLQKNVMHCQAVSLLKEISVNLMAEVIGSHRLFVMQVEMDVYTMLRKWLFLKLHSDWEGTMKELSRESDLYFKAKFSEGDLYYLETVEGQPYLPVFENLRLQHVVNDVSSVKIVEDDGIIPSAWLEPIFRQRWLQMLRVDQLNRTGMMRVGSAEFQKGAMRCGRVLDKDGQYCWRWTGYNFGVDLLVSFNSRLIFFKRNTLTQSCPGAVSLLDEREIVFELRVATFNVHGQTTFERSSGVKSFSLLKDEEAVVMTIDRHATFPLHISCHFLTYATLIKASTRS
ncbi:hypothetical protein CAPTEDRAFT_183544 [Capitella teleta]|uniref:BACK domain-containing protein n=1 Tax=Capitella teleta TaxID=283909 RepID=R7V3P6_CAPTE|nr:hypothetical protein CAPTEDRAFT_183544 [Capitella teleta]|eukprot:ELU13473.1 hypothetical protein CAPTEDRAFT_183544 [Capitella teleta]